MCTVRLLRTRRVLAAEAAGMNGAGNRLCLPALDVLAGETANEINENYINC